MVRANSAANEARTATERANNEARLAKAETQRANAAAAQAREERMRAEALAQQNADLAAQERLAREQLELAVKRAEEESGKATLARTEATTAQKTAIETARRSAVSKYIEEINAGRRRKCRGGKAAANGTVGTRRTRPARPRMAFAGPVRPWLRPPADTPRRYDVGGCAGGLLRDAQRDSLRSVSTRDR
jgi:hypothetical protein